MFLGFIVLSVQGFAATSKGLSAKATVVPAPIEEIVVFGRNADLVGSAESASEGFIAGSDLLIRPLVRTTELLESMPGMVAVQHSGSGKATSISYGDSI